MVIMIRNETPWRFPTRPVPWLLFGLLLLTACAPRLDVYAGARINYLDIVLAGTRELNRDQGGEAHPVVVRVYELASADNFQRSTAAALWEDDDRVLGDEYVGKQVLILQPGSELRLRLELKKDTRYVGIAGNFIDPDADRWRQLYDASTRRQQNRVLRVVLRENHLAIEPR